ncbi:glutamine-hydrolyzing carbamoyl-phosphate synthase small subunit [Sphingomonas oryzagri]
MADTNARVPDGATGVLVLASGVVLFGRGFGAVGAAVGEVCFHTAMTGYQEAMTDPSFEKQIITFTFPHIGNVGANAEDIEATNAHALGCIVREDVTAPSSFRAAQRFDEWLKTNGRIGLAGIDTRALTRMIRVEGAPNGVIAHDPEGRFDIPALIEQAKAWPGLEGMDLAKDVSALQSYQWDEGLWTLGAGYAARPSTKPVLSDAAGGVEGLRTNGVLEASQADTVRPEPVEGRAPSDDWQSRPHVVAIDYGLKRNILRNLVAAGARVTVVPATASFEDVMRHEPDGVFLSNGPGDPAATGEYAVPVIRQLLEVSKPIFGICLGHQMLGLAVGAKTYKMHQGHRGANHPVKRVGSVEGAGRVEITSMNHGFAVDADTLPANAEATHVSLFDGSLAGLRLTDKPAFSVQYHPEASPGPQDSHYLFEQFVGALGKGA